jgi:hypothetical protein
MAQSGHQTDPAGGLLLDGKRTPFNAKPSAAALLVQSVFIFPANHRERELTALATPE